jgi:DNA invertase Pin-like site-specific DNA recombinase
MIALGYVRRSSKKEKGNQVSIDVQREAVARYCKSQGFSLAWVVTHNGVSGTDRRRFKVINEALEGTKAKAVVVYNLDRLARDSAGLSDFLKHCDRHTIEVHETETGKIDFRKAMGRFTLTVRGAMDELYADLIGEKTSDALQHKRHEGQRYSNHAPFGWQHVYSHTDDRGRRKFKLVLQEEEQRALVIVDRCRALGMGRIRTLGRLRAEGYVGRGGLATIQALLEGPDLITDPENGPEKVVENQ